MNNAKNKQKERFVPFPLPQLPETTQSLEKNPNPNKNRTPDLSLKQPTPKQID